MAVYRLLLTVAALNGSVFGLLFILIPDFALGLFGGRLDAFSSLIVRQYGGAIVGIAILDWMLRNSEGEVRGAVVTANVVAFTIIAIVAAYGATSGIANPLAWVVAVFHGLVAVGLVASAGYIERRARGARSNHLSQR